VKTNSGGIAVFIVNIVQAWVGEIAVFIVCILKTCVGEKLYLL
jgi:hypothetical protein